MSFTDTILRGDRLTVATLLKPRCAYLGERTDKRAKSECDECAAFLPIYRCPIRRYCSPFGDTADPTLIVPCPCSEYRPFQSGIDSSRIVTIAGKGAE